MAASAGNHGQAVAWAAREVGVPATIFMPVDAPMAKIEATKNYGATVELGGAFFDDALAAAGGGGATGATFVHAFEDEPRDRGPGDDRARAARAGAGRRDDRRPDRRRGLASGIAIAVRALRPSIRIVGVQAAACAPFAGSEVAGVTIADGIAVKGPGELTSGILASCSTTSSSSPTTRSRRRSCFSSSGRSSWSRAPAPRPSQPCSRDASGVTARSCRSSPAATSTRRC